MGRYRPEGSYFHAVKRLPDGSYLLSWQVDRYYKGSRQRHPRRCTRETDEAGARRFCKRWGLELPQEV
jgi:hypothetical protein